jgi:perosamine synthetase
MQAHEELESVFGSWLGNPHTIACASGTAALHLAFEALAMPLGRLVAMPDYTMVACARAVSLAGLIPVFIDCKDNLLIDEELISTKNISAILAVHIYGRRCAMDKIAALADRVGAFLIEDLAEAHGVLPHPRTDAACWSFYRNKIVHGEEGGLVAFRSLELALRAKRLRCMGFTDDHDFYHIPRGHNYRLADLLAAPIIVDFQKLPTNLSLRRCVEVWYNSCIPEGWRMPPRDVVWVYDLRIPGITLKQQSQMVSQLNSWGVTARQGFKPMSQQAEYAGCRGGMRAQCLASEIIYLPVFPEMTFDVVEHNAKLLIDSVAKFI